ncbi:MAG: ATP-dependent helicase, partial [Cyanobacteria bacterium J06607_13]
MATLHGNWLPDSQTFFLWGETWRRAEAVSVDGDLTEGSLVPAAQPYQLTQSELLAHFEEPSDSVDLAWMQSALVPSGAAASKGGKGASARGSAKGKSAGRSAKKSDSWRSQVVVLPTRFEEDGLLPTLSAETPAAEDGVICLHPWQVSGGCLSAATTVKFLSALPLGRSEASAFVGDDLRYWSHLTRWSLDLLARGKFVPVVSGDKRGAIASWQLLLDSATDQTRLKDFCDRLPLICQSYAELPTKKAQKKASLLKVDLPGSAEAQVRSFLSTVVDAQVRKAARDTAIAPTAPLSKDLPLREWLAALGSENPHFESTPAGTVRLNDAINTWTAPLQNLSDTSEGFRTCFVL